jgi:hypothetical protein
MALAILSGEVRATTTLIDSQDLDCNTGSDLAVYSAEAALPHLPVSHSLLSSSLTASRYVAKSFFFLIAPFLPFTRIRKETKICSLHHPAQTPTHLQQQSQRLRANNMLLPSLTKLLPLASLTATVTAAPAPASIIDDAAAQSCEIEFARCLRLRMNIDHCHEIVCNKYNNEVQAPFPYAITQQSSQNTSASHARTTPSLPSMTAPLLHSPATTPPLRHKP